MSARDAERRLRAARLAGAAALGVLAQLAVDTPGGVFGGAEEATAHGWAFSTAVVTLAGGGAWAILHRGRRRGERTRAARAARQAATLLPPAVVALTLAAFLPLLAADPVVAGGIVLWHLALAGRLFFPGADVAPAAQAREGGDPWLARHGPALRHLLLVALLATTAVVGYRLADAPQAVPLCLLLDAAALGYATPDLVGRWRAGSRAPLLPLALVAAAALAAPRPTVALGLLGAAEVAVLALHAAARPLAREVAESFFRRPATLVLGTFVALILLGTLFLSFPAAGAGGVAVAPVDALFTATSAACVTGLIVLDTPHAFSTFGHVVILLLIQVGGLNIMVLSTFAALLLGRGIGLRGEEALAELLDLRSRRSAYPLIVFIVVSTLLAEAIGAALLTAAFRGAGDGPATALWKGVFHAVSAFCNAGFALQSDSLLMFQRAPWVLVVFAGLITAGGLGFGVLAALWLWLGGRLRRRRAARGDVPAHERPPAERLPMQARLVLVASGLLVVAGTAWFAAVEWERTLAGLAWPDKLANALFQSVTLRTAGFNSVDFAPLHAATVLMMIAFMFVGASPGSTGGGIKTTTAAVLFAALPSIARGESEVVLLGRSLPLETIYRATALLVIAAGATFAGLTCLLVFDDLAFTPALFEAVSAIGTVGLSLGATAELGVVGKSVVILLMLVGRVGPLTLALLLGRRGRGRVRYPEARVMVG